MYISIAIAAVLFVLFAYAAVTGFGYHVSSIGRSSVPFLTVADQDLGGWAVLAWIAGSLSVLAALVAGSSSQARMLFDGGRTGLLPAPLGRLRQDTGTPVNALVVMAVSGLGVIAVWWVAHLQSGHTGAMDPVGLYAECSTMGTIVIFVVYLLTNLSLPVFMWRRHRALFSPARHVVVPVIGSAVLIVPFVELCRPGQPPPYDTFPFIALALVAVAVAIAALVVHRHPSTGAAEAVPEQPWRLRVAGFDPAGGSRCTQGPVAPGRLLSLVGERVGRPRGRDGSGLTKKGSNVVPDDVTPW
jgi:amino acid transporter